VEVLLMSSLDNTGDGERTETRKFSKDGTRLVIVTRWLDRQVHPPKWRTKNRTQKLSAGEREYVRQRRESESAA